MSESGKPGGINDYYSLQDCLDRRSEWWPALQAVFESSPMVALEVFLRSEQAAGVAICPPADHCFAALHQTPLSRVRVVLLGQDPYHGPGQAHGLSFSVRPGVRIPPSLRNIFRELSSSLGVGVPATGCLSPWAEQGVLLLNTVLTVREGCAGAHQGRGWETLTDAILSCVSAGPHPVVFLLWGKPAQQKRALIDESRHLVLQAPHPSPLSAHRGFFGCDHFRLCNEWLAGRGRMPIDWRLELGPKQERPGSKKG